MRRISKVSTATTVPFAQCKDHHFSKTREKNKSYRPGRRLSQREPKFTKRAKESRSEGSWVASLRTRATRRTKSAMKSKQSSNRNAVAYSSPVGTQHQNALDSMRAGANVQERATQSSFLQYGDWFNHYPHGLSDAEFMDPATHKQKDSGADGVLEAKPELQSVGEYFSTLPTPQSVENKDTMRTAAPKRKQSAKKQTGMPAQPGQHLDPLQSTDADAVSQERKFSGGLGLQTTSAAGFNPLAASNPQNPAFSTTMSPMSPANVTAFAHHAHTPTFFSPGLLAMNFGQGSNGNIDPLDRQLVYGGYSMDASTGLGGGQ